MTDLVTKILSGNEQAVVELYNTYGKKILLYFQKRLPKEEDAQELMQDVFLEALDSLPMFERRSSMQTWLYGIAHHKVVDFYRKRKIKSLLLSQLPFLQLVAQEVNEPEFQYEKNKIRDNIEKTLHQLSEKYRTILKLHYEEDMPVKQIAAKMELSFKATESLLYRARMDFMQKYERE